MLLDLSAKLSHGEYLFSTNPFLREGRDGFHYGPQAPPHFLGVTRSRTSKRFQNCVTGTHTGKSWVGGGLLSKRNTDVEK